MDGFGIQQPVKAHSSRLSVVVDHHPVVVAQRLREQIASSHISGVEIGDELFELFVQLTLLDGVEAELLADTCEALLRVAFGESEAGQRFSQLAAGSDFGDHFRQLLGSEKAIHVLGRLMAIEQPSEPVASLIGSVFRPLESKTVALIVDSARQHESRRFFGELGNYARIDTVLEMLGKGHPSLSPAVRDIRSEIGAEVAAEMAASYGERLRSEVEAAWRNPASGWAEFSAEELTYFVSICAELAKVDPHAGFYALLSGLSNRREASADDGMTRTIIHQMWEALGILVEREDRSDLAMSLLGDASLAEVFDHLIDSMSEPTEFGSRLNPDQCRRLIVIDGLLEANYVGVRLRSSDVSMAKSSFYNRAAERCVALGEAIPPEVAHVKVSSAGSALFYRSSDLSHLFTDLQVGMRRCTYASDDEIFGFVESVKTAIEAGGPASGTNARFTLGPMGSPSVILALFKQSSGENDSFSFQVRFCRAGVDGSTPWTVATQLFAFVADAEKRLISANTRAQIDFYIQRPVDELADTVTAPISSYTDGRDVSVRTSIERSSVIAVDLGRLQRVVDRMTGRDPDTEHSWRLHASADKNVVSFESISEKDDCVWNVRRDGGDEVTVVSDDVVLIPVRDRWEKDRNGRFVLNVGLVHVTANVVINPLERPLDVRTLIAFESTASGRVPVRKAANFALLDDRAVLAYPISGFDGSVASELEQRFGAIVKRVALEKTFRGFRFPVAAPRVEPKSPPTPSAPDSGTQPSVDGPGSGLE